MDRFINLLPIMGSMSYIRNKPRKLKSGEIVDYYYLVESQWKNGKSYQKVIKYLGTSPDQHEFTIDNKVAGQLAQALIASGISGKQIRDLLEKLGLSIPSDDINEVSLIYSPPKKVLRLRIRYAKTSKTGTKRKQL
jgi:hypothetical protein